MKIEHIAYIMDGNRRYAKKQQISKKEGYKKGMEKFLEFISFQVKYGVKETSFFALSNDNYLKRSNEELDSIFNLIEWFSNNEDIETFFLDNKVKLNLIGDIDYVEKNETKRNPVKKSIIKKLKKKALDWNTKIGENKFTVNLAINYDGQLEIVTSVKKIFQKISSGEITLKQVNENLIKDNMWFNSEPAQIIVRPGDAPRLSGFMLWDSKYSEIYLTKKLWPELDEADFVGILDWYKNIQRNFGK